MSIIVKKTIHALIMLTCFFSISINASQTRPIINNLTKNHTSPPSMVPTLVPTAPKLSAKSYLLMDAMSGKIIAEQNMNKRFPPASLTKIMTLYLTFQALQSGQIHLTDQVKVSHKAWRMGGSRMFIKVGSLVSVQDLIRGIIVASGNDACVAIAQYVGGSESTFADLMNQVATRLGMKNTNFIDSTGLPNPSHYSSAKDIAILTRAIIRDFPEYYHFFNEKWINYNHIKQPNRNRLLWRDPTIDGLKTGHTKKAGYCLVASAKRNDMRLITIVLGASSDNSRASNSQSLLNYGFRFYKTYKLFDAQQPITTRHVWLGEEKQTTLGLSAPLYITIPISEYKYLKASLTLNGRLTAPLLVGKQYGSVTVTLRDQIIATKPLVALQNNPKGGLLSRLGDHIMMFIKG